MLSLKNKGYFTARIDSTKKHNQYHFTYINFGVKTEVIKLTINSKQAEILKNLNYSTNKGLITINSKDLESLLLKLTNYLNKEGKSFSKVQLKNIQVNNKLLTANLTIKQSKKRSIDKLIIKGYNAFPKSFLKNNIDILGKTFNKEILYKTSNFFQKLNFVEETKKPEVLFSNDSTIVFLYLKKKKTNTIDGLINFSSESNKLKFRGYLDLKLNNTFDYGEEININWNNFGNQKQNLNSSFYRPYIYGSKISLKLSFNLYRHDSTFTNTSYNISSDYSLNSTNKISVLYFFESSYIQSNTNSNIEYRKKVIGPGYSYKSKHKRPVLVNFNFLLGHKKTSTEKSAQYQFDFMISKELNLSKNISVYLKSKTSKMFSNLIIENELFREGGNNSIRGFNNQSIFTDTYSFINNEIRLNLINKSKIYSIHDFGIFSINKKSNILYSLGLGYMFQKKNNLINISISKGFSGIKKIKNNEIININLTSFF